MAVELKVPSLGESVTQAQVGQWLKKEGEAVVRDEPVVEVESEKATVAVPAPASGVLRRVLRQTGETVAVGQLLGEIEEGAVAAAGPAPPAAPAHAAPGAAPPPRRPPPARGPPRPSRRRRAPRRRRGGGPPHAGRPEAPGREGPAGRPTSCACSRTGRGQGPPRPPADFPPSRDRASGSSPCRRSGARWPAGCSRPRRAPPSSPPSTRWTCRGCMDAPRPLRRRPSRRSTASSWASWASS